MSRLIYYFYLGTYILIKTKATLAQILKKKNISGTVSFFTNFDIKIDRKCLIFYLFNNINS